MGLNNEKNRDIFYEMLKNSLLLFIQNKMNSVIFLIEHNFLHWQTLMEKPPTK